MLDAEGTEASFSQLGSASTSLARLFRRSSITKIFPGRTDSSVVVPYTIHTEEETIMIPEIPYNHRVQSPEVQLLVMVIVFLLSLLLILISRV
jgi:hypothetical protein